MVVTPRDPFNLNNFWVRQTFARLGSGCGSVGRAVAFDTRDLRFESSHRRIFKWNIWLPIAKSIEKTKIKEKKPGMACLKKTFSTVGQMVQRLLRTPEIHSLNPVIGKFIYCQLIETMLKRRKYTRGREWPNKNILNGEYDPWSSGNGKCPRVSCHEFESHYQMNHFRHSFVAKLSRWFKRPGTFWTAGDGVRIPLNACRTKFWCSQSSGSWIRS